MTSFGGLDPIPLAQARIAILPIPYGATLSYAAGAADGPAALLEASTQMELFDEALLQETWRAGIATLAPVEPNLASPEAMMARIHHAARPHLEAGRFLAGLGGEHSVTVGLMRAYRERFGTDLSVLQIDAHADLRDSYHETPFSHACVMRRLDEMGFPFVQVGIRSLSAPEWDLIQQRDWRSRIFWAREVMAAERRGERDWIDAVIARLGPTVYITLDLDGLDPAVMPTTGTPEPGGLDYHALLALLGAVARQRRVIGCDLTELSPIPGLSHGPFTAARILYRLLGEIHPLTGS